MQKNLSDYRKSYNKGELLEDSLNKAPFELFDTWWNQIKNETYNQSYASAVLTYTIRISNSPKGCIVSLQDYSKSGFVLSVYDFSNQDIKEFVSSSANVCLSFFWGSLERQVIIQGTITCQVSEAEELKKRHQRTLESSSSHLKFKPYLLVPEKIEFWQGRPNRLHDRIIYCYQNSCWTFKRLAP